MKKFTTFLLGFLVCLNLSFACMNDRSSINFEKQRFPQEQDLLAGSFYLHSKEFHKWRITDRLKKLEKDSDNPALLDDLSVSYEKTGQTELAIETLQSVLNKYPNRYETLANLGTFYIHNQQYQKGLELLKKAIQINPQAHYGREIYQIKVVEYILSLNKKPPFVFPIQKDKDFADFLLKDLKKSEQKDELIRAIVGVSGMLKFGNSDSPILLEVLGDLYLRIYKDYTWPTGYNNQLEDYAVEFYTAAYLRTGDNFFIIIKQDYSHPYYFNSKKILEKFLIYKNIKINPLDNNINDIHSLAESIKRGNEYKESIYKAEIEIIKSKSNPEEVIYTTLFAPSNLQPDLFQDKKAQIIDALARSYKEFGKEVAKIIYSAISLIGTIASFIVIFISLIIINILYFRHRKLTVQNNDVNFLFYGMLLLNSIAINILFILLIAFNYTHSYPFFFITFFAQVILYVIYQCMFVKHKFELNNIQTQQLIKLLKLYYKIYLWILLAVILVNVIQYVSIQLFGGREIIKTL